LLCAALGTVTSGARASDVPAGLAGEHFDTFGPDSTVSVTGRTCDRNGQSTLTFVADGPASGPYPGRFHEEATVTLGPHVLVDVEGNPEAMTLGFDATFTIESAVPNATITGTKTIADIPLGDRVGWCENIAQSGIGDQFSAQNQPVRYDAVIDTGSGRFADSGQGQGSVYMTINPISPIYLARYFWEDFHSDFNPPTALQSKQTISFDPLPDRTSIDLPLTVSATASSGLPVSFSVAPGSQCTVDGDTVTITGVGSCTVIASQAGNIDWYPAPDVSRTFAIAQAYPARFDDCKIGAWPRYGLFPNQGSCVSYVATHKPHD
jgi:hypothetical protein